jgi:nucleoside-diphosphate-sugar epimerase
MTSSDLNVILGAGPMGRAIARRLLAQGQRVRIVTRMSAPEGLVGAEHLRADLMTAEGAMAACAGAGVIFHGAAPAYHRWVAEFPMLQDNIIAAAGHSGAVLGVIENLYAYGVAGTLHESLPLAATTRKGRVRAEMTRRLFAAHEAGRIRAVVGRAADYFGPEVQVSAFGERLWQPLLAGKAVPWIGDPDALHSATYVPDFADALIRLAATPKAWGRAWHVPSPPARPPRAFIAAAAGLAGLPVPKISRVPPLILRAVGLVQPAAGEMVEMLYSFDRPFVIAHEDYDRVFGTPATGWDKALAATLGWWRGPGSAA